MEKLNARKIIYDRFFSKFDGKASKNIGVELEFPLVNANGGDVDKKVAKKLLDFFINKGFSPVLYGDSGQPLFIEDANGDTLSFDNSYNNFEFSLKYADNLTVLADRFYKLLSEVQDFLGKNGHYLVGRGTNPNKNNITSNRVDFSTYKMVADYLTAFPGEHQMNDFPAYLSSVQTHLDVELESLPKAYTTYAMLDFLRAMLFSNSPDFEGKGYICYRDYLWEKSGFGRCPNITGKVNERFETVADLEDYFLKKGMFNRIRNGKYEVFAPVNIKEYFENEKYGALAEDIECYLSFKNVEITSRGTLEVRSDCAQSFENAFAPPAFNLGVMEGVDEIYDIINAFFADNDITMSNSKLRDIVVSGGDLAEYINGEALYMFLCDILTVVEEKLTVRGFDEEKYIEHLWDKINEI